MSMISSFSISREDIFSIKIIILVFRVYIEVSLIYSDDFFFVSKFEKPKAINIKSKFDRLHSRSTHTTTRIPTNLTDCAFTVNTYDNQNTNKFDRLRIHRQHIRQPEYQQSKAKEHLRVCGKQKRIFEMFKLFKMRIKNSKLLRESCEVYFMVNLNRN